MFSCNNDCSSNLICHEWFIIKASEKIPLAKYFKRILLVYKVKTIYLILIFKKITFISFVFAAIFLFMIPNDSSDIYGYLARGSQQIDYGLNPYHFTVSEIDQWLEQPLLANINHLWSYNPAPYGPVSYVALCSPGFLITR